MFLHEVLHVIDTDMELDLGERKVNLLAIHILSFIVNNKIDFLK